MVFYQHQHKLQDIYYQAIFSGIGEMVVQEHIIKVNFLSIAYGAACGWPSASFLILQSDDSPLETGKITVDDASWIAAFLCIGGFLACIVFGSLSDLIGRKKCLLLLGLPQIISWILIIFARNAYYLYASRFFSGIAGGGTLLLIQIYVAEISEDKIRGASGSLLCLTFNFGVLLAYILGNFLNYIVVPSILIVIPVIFLCSFWYFPETPYHLITKSRTREAENSLKFLRDLSREDASNALASELNKFHEDRTVAEANQMSLTEMLSYAIFNATARKAMLIGICMMALCEFNGAFTISAYAGTIFVESGSTLSPNQSAIICGCILLISSFLSTFLVDIFGRKILLITSSLGTSIAHAIFGIYSLLDSLDYAVDPYNWIPIFALSLSLFMSSYGLVSLPFVVVAEIIPEKIRSFGVTVCACALWTFSFIDIKFFPLVVDEIGLYAYLFFFAACCFVGTFFIIFFLPETKVLKKIIIKYCFIVIRVLQ